MAPTLILHTNNCWGHDSVGVMWGHRPGIHFSQTYILRNVMVWLSPSIPHLYSSLALIAVSRPPKGRPWPLLLLKLKNIIAKGSNDMKTDPFDYVQRSDLLLDFLSANWNRNNCIIETLVDLRIRHTTLIWWRSWYQYFIYLFLN